ncbi:MAG: FAD-linked oxidase C-terminal domain-containing protein, partial [bacterium]
KNKLKIPDSLVTDLSQYQSYFHDATEDSGVPEAILFAENDYDIIKTLKFCQEQKLSVVPRGAGTGLSGGCVPTKRSIVLSTEKMQKLEIDQKNRIALCGPGVITKNLQDKANDVGLAYPPDPASYEESTLGGNVAENAGGLRCKRFGVTKDYVIGLKGIFADGNAFSTGIYNKDNGFNLGDVFIASEGTLCIITEIAVRLIDAVMPGNTLLAAFDSPKDGANAVSEIVKSGIIPTVLEYIDGDAAACVNEYEKTDFLDNAKAILLIETSDSDISGQTALIRKICKSNSSKYLRIEEDSQKAESLWKVRRNISKAMKALGKIRVSEDVAVPISKFPEIVDFVRELNTKSLIRINCYGHAGDGNLHVNMMGMKGTESEREEIEKNVEQVMIKTIQLGGTISGEHGIGLAKRRFMGLEFDKYTILYMLKFKEIFDPGNILNPGKIFP